MIMHLVQGYLAAGIGCSFGLIFGLGFIGRLSAVLVA